MNSNGENPKNYNFDKKKKKYDDDKHYALTKIVLSCITHKTKCSCRVEYEKKRICNLLLNIISVDGAACVLAFTISARIYKNYTLL